jgi:hypothetical protein
MAENKPERLSKEEYKKVILKESHGDIRVLAVGINAYPNKSGFHELKKCVNDAFQVAATFREVHQLNADPDHIVLMTSETAALLPHRGLIFDQLHELANGATEGDRLLFYFSGHGHRIDGVEDHFLVPQDVFSEAKPDALISMREVLAILEESPAKQKIIVLDACLSGPILLGKKLHAADFSDKFFAEYLASTKGVAVLSSSAADEASYEKSPNPKVSLFTFYFIQALRGDPAALDDKLLTVPTLFDYVSTLVKRDCKSYRLQQTPSLKTSATGTFVLADFRQSLVVASSVNLKAHPFNALVFRDTFGERTKAILTEWSNRSKTASQLEYAINNQGGLEKYLEEPFAEWRPIFRKHFGFTASEIETGGSSFKFPGGWLGYNYEATSKDGGNIHRELNLDIDWFDNGPRLKDLLSILHFEPELLELGLKNSLKPMDQIAGLEANGWNILKEAKNEVVASKDGITMTVTEHALSFDGFDIKDLLEDSSAQNDDQLLLAETISIVAPAKRLAGAPISK